MNNLINKIGIKRGYISNAARVDDLAYIDSSSKILDCAQVLNGAEVCVKSTIKNNAIVKDTVWVDSSTISGNVVLCGDCYVCNCQLSENVRVSGKIVICDLNFSGNIHLHSEKRIWIDDKKDLKRFVKNQDKTNDKNIVQIMDEELSIFECKEI